MLKIPSQNQAESVRSVCYSVAGNRHILAACLYGPQVSGYAHENSDINALLVLRGYKPLVKTYEKRLEERAIFLLAVDQRAFQRDVSKGWLGEFAAEKLVTPYEPLINEEYLWRQEVELKKRIVWELLEALVLEFPELSHELLIEPKYFMYETLMKRARLFPSVTYRFLNMLGNDVKEENVESMMRGYRQALEELAKEGWIVSSDARFRLTPRLIKTIRSRRLRIPVVLRSVQRAALLHIVSALPKMMSPLGYDQELYDKTHGEIAYNQDLTSQLEDPENYLLVPTPLGPVPLSDKTSIEDFVRRTVPDASVSQVKTTQIGGVLNSVYLLTLQRDHEQQRVVVKKFKDWVGFKWFPLALWALGTKSFAVLGRSRLEREYALNQFLQSHGASVPRILYVSPQQSFVFKEFVEGENLVEVIKRVMTDGEKAVKELALIRDVGRKIAEAHRLGVALGDCKPENVVVTKKGRLYFVDLEQASRDGNQAWDVAEFLYYSGHYVPPLASAEPAELIAKSFVEGYLEAGGEKETVRKAGSPRYTKVFSIFTQPHVILALSNLCRRMGARENS